MPISSARTGLLGGVAISTFLYPPHPVAPRICDSEHHPHPKPTPGFTALPVLASDMALSWVTEPWEQFPSESHRDIFGVEQAKGGQAVLI